MWLRPNYRNALTKPLTSSAAHSRATLAKQLIYMAALVVAKATLWQLLDVEAQTGIKLTESYAMWPGAAVSGWYFAHPDSKYFAVSKIGTDQKDEYAAKKGWSTDQADSWLAPNLG